jgi:hypothetical protein
VISAVGKCEVGRRVAVFKQRPGTDRRLGTVRGEAARPGAVWGMGVPQAKTGRHVYARASEVRPAIGLVCRADRSPIYTVR